MTQLRFLSAARSSPPHWPAFLLLLLMQAPGAAAMAAGGRAAPPQAEPEAVDQAAIPWVKGHAAALQAARAERKPLLVDFEAEWCGFCKKLDRETYADEQVIRFVRASFIAVKVDTDKEPELAKKYQIRSLPTIVFLSSDGDELQRIEGFQPAELFLANAKKSVDAGASLVGLKELAAKDPDDLAAQRAYARALFAAGNHESAMAVFQAARARSSPSVPGRAGLLLDMADACRLSGKNPEARGLYEEILLLPTELAGQDRHKASVPLARVLLSLRDQEGAIRILSRFIEEEAKEPRERLEALFLRGYAHAVRKQPDLALADLKKARDLDPEGRWGARASMIIDLVETR